MHLGSIIIKYRTSENCWQKLEMEKAFGHYINGCNTSVKTDGLIRTSMTSQEDGNTSPISTLILSEDQHSATR